MNPVSSTIVEGICIFYPTLCEPKPAPDPTLFSVVVRTFESWHWLYVFREGSWVLAYEQPFPHPSSVITAAIRYARQAGYSA